MTNSINLKNNKSNGLSLSLLAAAIAILSAPALAQGDNTTDVNAAREAVAHAGRMAETPTISLKSDRERLHQDSGGSIENKQTIDAAAARAQAYSNLAAAEAREADIQFINDSVARADQRQAVADARQADIDHCGVKENASLKPQYNAPKQTISYSGASLRPNTNAINISVTSMKPDAPVKVTENGVSHVTTAANVAQRHPDAQVSVHLASVFSPERRQSQPA